MSHPVVTVVIWVSKGSEAALFVVNVYTILGFLRLYEATASPIVGRDL